MSRWERWVLGFLAVSVFFGAFAATAQNVNVPHFIDDQVLSSASPTFEVFVNTPTLPVKPRVRVIATPDLAHSDMVLEVEVLDCDQDAGYIAEPCFGSPDPCICEDYFDFVSIQDPGTTELVADVWECLPIPTNDSALPDQCTVRVTVINFGTGAGSPATVDLEITAEEAVLTSNASTFVDTSFTPAPVSVVLEASKDTTLYKDLDTSNGAGQHLLSGRSFLPFNGDDREFKTLLAFDLVDPLGNPIPAGSKFTSAALTLNVSGLPDLATLTTLRRMDPFRDWGEGTNDAFGTETSGLAANVDDATWDDYRFPDSGWLVGGGDTIGSPSASLDIFSTGPAVWQGAGLLADLGIMVLLDSLDGSPLNQGWQLDVSWPMNEQTPFSFDSRESPTPANRPSLAVTYQQNPVSEADMMLDANVLFITDADNFRWIYDNDGDEIVTTAVQAVAGAPHGQCLLLDPNDENAPPFLYTYLGEPDVVGHDCCVWQADTTKNIPVPPFTEVVSTGAGQAVIHLNQSTSIPIPDWDGDGIGDPCDNCFAVPNGPAEGSCMPDDGSGGDGLMSCLSDLDCDSGEICSLAQEDDDVDGVGTACPEPSTTLALSIGLLALAGLPRRRSRRFA